MIFFQLVFQTGNIFVFTGMLQTCTNDDQLGVILGHEIAHTVLSHGVSIMFLSYTFLNEGIIFGSRMLRRIYV